MAGLFDSNLMKLFYGGSQFMKDRESQRQSTRAQDAYTGLLGSAATQVPNAGDTVSYGLLDGQQQQPVYNAEVPGTGLMGGQMGTDEFNRRLQGEYTGIPQFRPVAQAMQLQNMQGEQAMQRTQYQNNTLSADARVNNLYKEQSQAYKNEDLYRNNTEMAGNILGQMSDGEGTIDYNNTNGVQHNQLVLTLAKSILGNEAVNVDDRGAITLAGGAPAYLSNLVAQVNGGGLGESSFYNVVNSLQSNIETGMKRNQAMRARSQGRITDMGGNETWMPVATNPVQRYRSSQLYRSRRCNDKRSSSDQLHRR